MLSCGKNGRFARFLVDKGVPADFPACVSGYAQAVQMGFDAVVEFRQIVEVVMGLGDCGVTQEPEEGGVFGVLDDDVFDDH